MQELGEGTLLDFLEVDDLDGDWVGCAIIDTPINHARVTLPDGFAYCVGVVLDPLPEHLRMRSNVAAHNRQLFLSDPSNRSYMPAPYPCIAHSDTVIMQAFRQAAQRRGRRSITETEKDQLHKKQHDPQWESHQCAREYENESLIELPYSLADSFLKTSKLLCGSLTSAYKSTLQAVSELKTNFAYTAKNTDCLLPVIIRKQICIRNDDSTLWLLGKSYDSEQGYLFQFQYRNTFWFTYRKDIEALGSDNGWGCMIRAVQMILAETLKRHLHFNSYHSEPHEIIQHFNDEKKGVFSIARICRAGRIEQRWTSSLEVFGILQTLLKTEAKHLQLAFQIYGNCLNYLDFKSQEFSSYPSLVALSNRVGLKNIPLQMQSHYTHLMKHPAFVGGVGGVGGEALYILGFYDDRVIFLDPHYVQSNTEALNARTYFNDTPRGIAIDQLSPSISFCYYIRSREQHKSWLEWMTSLSQAHYPDLIFDVMTIEKKEAVRKKCKEEEESFEML